jgi:hypothetical protein
MYFVNEAIYVGGVVSLSVCSTDFRLAPHGEGFQKGSCHDSSHSGEAQWKNLSKFRIVVEKIKKFYYN